MAKGRITTENFSVSIVIPNWNGVYLLEKHLKKVKDAAGDAEIIIADDTSSDGSVEFIRNNFPSVTVVRGVSHKGFASTVNAGVAAAHGEIVILLNTDVEPDPGFIAPLVTHFRDDSVFAVGCLEKSIEQGKTVLRGRGIAHWTKGYYIHSRGAIRLSNTAWVSGGSGAFRKSMWDTLDGLDTLYNPFYWEDIDLSYRARKSGWKTLFEPNSIVHHFHDEGKVKREFTPDNIKKIAYRNQFTFIWKNTTDAGILLAHVLWTPVRLVRALLSGDYLMTAGFFLALSRFPIILMRRHLQKNIYTLTDRGLDMMS